MEREEFEKLSKEEQKKLLVKAGSWFCADSLVHQIQMTRNFCLSKEDKEDIKQCMDVILIILAEKLNV